MDKKTFQTPQEKFWAGSFGNEYIHRNQGDHLLASNLSLYGRILNRMDPIKSCIEFGANIGMNLKAIKTLVPDIVPKGVEINQTAASELAEVIGQQNVINESILELQLESKADLSLIKGVLIHIQPEMLPIVYEKLYNASNKYVLVIEYYNPSPVTISYRGHEDRLFKRDFAGEMLDKFNDLKLIDYGFVYHRDLVFPQDDLTWFLMEKGK